MFWQRENSCTLLNTFEHFIWLHPSFFWIGDLKRTMISVRKEKQISFSCKLNFSHLAMTDKIIMALLYFLLFFCFTVIQKRQSWIRKQDCPERTLESDWDPLKFSTHTMIAEVGGAIIIIIAPHVQLLMSAWLLKLSNMRIPWWSHLVINLSKKNYNFFGQAIHHEPA